MSYCDTIDATPPAQRWHLVKKLMHDEPHAFFAEMRERRPVLALPNLTLAFRYADCALVLRRHDDFGVDLYRPKQGDYFMAQDDTADHWRDKSIMRAILDYEEIPRIRAFVAETTRNLLKAGKGRIDLTKAVSRAVPVAVVREFFGLGDGDPAELTEISYWSQQDAFHNQPFDEAPDAAKIVAEREQASIRLGLLIARIVAKKSIPAKLGLGGEDSVTRLLKLSFSGGVKFPVKKVLFNAGGLLIGAVETTSHCVNNVFAELFCAPRCPRRGPGRRTQRPGQRQRRGGARSAAVAPGLPLFLQDLSQGERTGRRHPVRDHDRTGHDRAGGDPLGDVRPGQLYRPGDVRPGPLAG